jgi:hypothetical protein
MPIDSRSPNRNYPIPNAANLISEDFPRLITALNAIDTDVHGLLSSVAARALLVHTHTIADVSGLQAALDGKQPVGTTYTLASLTDVNVAGVSTGQFLVRGATQWQPSTFNPATKADLAGASFTGGISGTTAAFTGIVEGAAATSGGHLLNRTTADARYDRITTSPTALTNGATIPSTENGRFYSMALPAVQTCSLPASAGLPDGFSVIVRATGMPSGFQTSYVGGNSKNIQYRGQGYAFFVLVGLTETFRFTWVSGLDVWLAECLQQPLIIEMSRGHNAMAWNSGSTGFVGLYYNTVGGTSSIFNVSNSSITLVPAAGVYTYNHRVHMSANAGGGTSGVGYMVGVNKVSGVADSSQGYIFTGMDTTGLSDNFMNLWNTQSLQQGQIVGAAYSMSVSTLWVFPGNNAQTITLVSR